MTLIEKTVRLSLAALLLITSGEMLATIVKKG